jgi:hypothetical protein
MMRTFGIELKQQRLNEQTVECAAIGMHLRSCHGWAKLNLFEGLNDLIAGFFKLVHEGFER